MRPKFTHKLFSPHTLGSLPNTIRLPYFRHRAVAYPWQVAVLPISTNHMQPIEEPLTLALFNRRMRLESKLN
jgi:hypothetical protein